MKTTTNQVLINPSVTARVLAAIALILIAASIAGQYSTFFLGHDHLKGLVPLFNLNRELNIPTYFSVLLILFACLILSAIALLKKKQRAPDSLYWIVLAAGFLLMGFDEAFQVHERFTEPTRAFLGGDNLGFLYFAWVLPGMVLVLFLSVFFLKFLWRLPKDTRFRFVAAAVLYIGGAIGFNLISGKYFESRPVASFTYNMLTTAEESLEITGLIVFIWALLKYCADNLQELQIRFEA